MSAAPAQWRFLKFGLFVTGKGEALFLPSLFRALMAGGDCSFAVCRKIEQLSPITSDKRKKELKILGGHGRLPQRDEEFALAARAALRGGYDFILFIDDLERDRVRRESGEGMDLDKVRAIYRRYRDALDRILGAEQGRAGVHFLVNMLEAYYFADARAVNQVLGTDLTDHPGDVETIRHPKNDLKRLAPAGFDEVKDGQEIVKLLDVAQVLSNPETCAALRSLFGWCCAVLSRPVSSDFRLADGVYFTVTGAQIASCQ